MYLSSIKKMIHCSVESLLTIQMAIQLKAVKQYFPVVLFIMLYKVVRTVESVGEILKCDH